MKKLQSSLKNMLLVLTGITIVSVGLLGFVNEMTKAPIEEAKMKALNDALKVVVPPFDNNPVHDSDTIFEEKDGKKTVKFIIYPATKDGKRVGTAIQASSMGFGGEMQVLVGFDDKGDIYNYSLLAHSETPGLGSKADTWFKKGGKGDIIGKNPGEQPLTVSKDGGQIDAITASTITSRAFLKAVNAAYAAYSGNTDASTGASQQAEQTPTDANSGASQQTEEKKE